MRTFLASVALAVGVGISGVAHAADCSALQIRNTVKMAPIARYGLMVVPITLNGVEKKFLFDTGGGLNSISRATVQELKLPEYHSNVRASDLYGEDSDTFVQVHEVAFGAAKTSGVQLQVMGNFGFKDGNAPFDGILATGYFNHDDVDLDFGAERVNFFSTDHCEGKVVYWPHQVLSVVSVKLEQGHIDLPVTLDGHPLHALIDTGATRTTLNLTRAVEKLDFSPNSSSPPGAFKDAPNAQIYPRRFGALSFEGVTVANPVIIVQPLQSGGSDNRAALGSRAEHMDDETNRLSPDMIVGMDVLRRLHLYLATDEEKLYITEAGTGESVLFKAPAAH
ncbi:MAG TPA: retropepsin-like aspartic protease [Rhizomicrobium sp.]|jgi:predicted aspartyl protease|nr:retropepsin-like aspartic protease [Rhizomicrobium sp.]